MNVLHILEVVSPDASPKLTMVSAGWARQLGREELVIGQGSIPVASPLQKRPVGRRLIRVAEPFAGIIIINDTACRGQASGI